MRSLRIDGATHRLGAPTNWSHDAPPCDPLYARFVSEDGLNRFITAWEPTPGELARLAAGAPIYLSIVGVSHPPVAVSVGDPP